MRLATENRTKVPMMGPGVFANCDDDSNGETHGKTEGKLLHQGQRRGNSVLYNKLFEHTCSNTVVWVVSSAAIAATHP